MRMVVTGLFVMAAAIALCASSAAAQEGSAGEPCCRSRTSGAGPMDGRQIFFPWSDPCPDDPASG